MKTWIVTGGAASGKSMFCQHLQALAPGTVLFSSDVEVHELMALDQIKAQIANELGSQMLDAEGKVNRVALRDKVFASADERKKLEDILHHHVFKKLASLQEELTIAGKTELLIAEIPLFYETSSRYPADLVILVAISPTLQRQRMVSTRGLTTETADLILSAQLPLPQKLEKADKVVWNEGDPALLKLQAQLLLQPSVNHDA
jgi:dephospho-CoA kinase